MKKIITFISISLFCILSLSAQERKRSKAKIIALKISYLTEQLNLTTEEAEKFWPIYNTFNKEQYTLRNKQRSEIKKVIKSKGEIDLISEKVAENLISLKLTTDKQLLESQRAFVIKIKKIISAKKIIKLQMAEKEFGIKLMNRYRNKKK